MSADTILHNAKIATNGVPSFAEAIAITAGKIAAVGNNEDILRMRGPQTHVIDGHGRTVIPGLNDSHMHPIRGGLNYNLELRSAHVEGTGCKNSRASVGTGDRRLDRISVR